MVERHSRTQKNGRQISSGELRRGGPCGPIGVNISTTRDKGYRTGVHGSGKSSKGKLLHRLFFGKLKTLPPIVGALSTFLLKKPGLVLQNPVTSEKEK